MTWLPAGVGGMQRHTHELIPGLVARGHQVDVICPGDPSLAPDTYGARWWFVERVDPLRRFQTPGWRESTTAALARIRAEHEVDVVHSEGSSALGLVTTGALGPTPLVVKFHGNFLGLVSAAARRSARAPVRTPRELAGVARLSRLHFGARNWHAFRPHHAIVPSAVELRSTQASHLLRRERVHVVPNGVDPELWRPRPRPERGRPRLVTAGRLDAKKGIDVAIRALQRVDATLTIAGLGDSETALRQLARELGVADRTEFVGRMDRSELAQLVGEADAFVLPTRQKEAGSMALLEAMSSGVPVVASAFAGIREVVDRPGRNGVLVKAGSAAALGEALAWVLADEQRRAAIGAAGRERVLEAYTLGQMIERTERVYELALERNAEAA